MEVTISKAEYDAAMAQKDGQIAALRYELDQLKRLIFASKSERFVPASLPGQAALWDDKPEHLPVRREVIEPQEGPGAILIAEVPVSTIRVGAYRTG